MRRLEGVCQSGCVGAIVGLRRVKAGVDQEAIGIGIGIGMWEQKQKAEDANATPTRGTR